MISEMTPEILEHIATAENGTSIYNAEDDYGLDFAMVNTYHTLLGMLLAKCTDTPVSDSPNERYYPGDHGYSNTDYFVAKTVEGLLTSNGWAIPRDMCFSPVDNSGPYGYAACFVEEQEDSIFTDSFSLLDRDFVRVLLPDLLSDVVDGYFPLDSEELCDRIRDISPMMVDAIAENAAEYGVIDPDCFLRELDKLSEDDRDDVLNIFSEIGFQYVTVTHPTYMKIRKKMSELKLPNADAPKPGLEERFEELKKMFSALTPFGNTNRFITVRGREYFLSTLLPETDPNDGTMFNADPLLAFNLTNVIRYAEVFDAKCSEMAAELGLSRVANPTGI